ncbi:MAG: hypothetical protein VST70_05295 [Nitrospirota bacterium]|nr:hypothetical protein [Nitrospirota bacterium]
MEQNYVQMTRHTASAHLVLTEDQINRSAENAGVDLAPTGKMLSYAQDLAKAQGMELPEGVGHDFDLCRSFLNTHAPQKLEERESLDFGLERVESLINSLSQSREKANALDFAIEEPEKERETLEKTEDREPGREKGRDQERERYRDIGRDDLGLGL